MHLHHNGLNMIEPIMSKVCLDCILLMINDKTENHEISSFETVGKQAENTKVSINL